MLRGLSHTEAEAWDQSERANRSFQVRQALQSVYGDDDEDANGTASRSTPPIVRSNITGNYTENENSEENGSKIIRDTEISDGDGDGDGVDESSSGFSLGDIEDSESCSSHNRDYGGQKDAENDRGRYGDDGKGYHSYPNTTVKHAIGSSTFESQNTVASYPGASILNFNDGKSGGYKSVLDQENIILGQELPVNKSGNMSGQQPRPTDLNVSSASSIVTNLNSEYEYLHGNSRSRLGHFQNDLNTNTGMGLVTPISASVSSSNYHHTKTNFEHNNFQHHQIPIPLSIAAQQQRNLPQHTHILRIENESLKEQIRNMTSQQEQNHVEELKIMSQKLVQAERKSEEYRKEAEEMRRNKEEAENDAIQLRTELEKVKENKEEEMRESMTSLKDRIQTLTKERDVLREDFNEILQSRIERANGIHNPLKILEKKYQVEIDNMRSVAEQVQAEADDKLKNAEREFSDRKKDLEKSQKELKKVSAELVKWKDWFQSLVERLSILEESGAWDGPSVRMDRVVTASLGEVGIKAAEPLIGKFLRRFGATRATEKRFADSLTQTNSIQVHASSTQTDLYGSLHENDISSTTNTNAATSMSPSELNDEDYRSNAINSTLRKDLSQLQSENAKLCGSNQHLKEQIERYRKQVQELRGVSGSILSPSVNGSPSKLTEECFRLRTACEELNQSNAKLLQENKILKEGREIIEEENYTVAQRCVDLERLAEDATHECENLMKKIVETENHIESLEKEKKELDSKVQSLKDEEMRNAKANKTRIESLESELSREIQNFKEKHDVLIHCKEKSDEELKALISKNSDLEKGAEMARNEGRRLQVELESLRNKFDIIVKSQSDPEEMKNLVAEKLKVENEKTNLLLQMKEKDAELSQLSQMKIDLEDECGRLRNVNNLIKTKIDSDKSEVGSLKKENESLQRRNENLLKSLEEARVENVCLSDNKTDMEVEGNLLRKECSTLMDSVQQYKNDLEKLNLDLDANRNENESLKIELQQLKEEKTKLSKLNTAMESTCNELRKENLVINGKNKSLFSEKSSLDEKCQSLQLCEKEMKKKEAALEKKCIQLEEEIKSRTEQNNIFQKELQQLKEEHELTISKILTSESKNTSSHQTFSPDPPTTEEDNDETEPSEIIRTQIRAKSMPASFGKHITSNNSLDPTKQRKWTSYDEKKIVQFEQSKHNLSAVRSSLFAKENNDAEQVQKDPVFERVEKSLNPSYSPAVNQVHSSGSSFSTDSRLERLKVASDRAATVSKYIASLKKSRTPGTSHNSSVQSESKDKTPRQNPTGNFSLEETEAFVMNIIKSCRKKDQAIR